MTTLSTHVLDTAIGRPAEGMRVRLFRETTMLGYGETDADGRLAGLREGHVLTEGIHHLVFGAGDYFALTGRECFYTEIEVRFRVAAGDAHLHVPLLVSPFGYSTYRGS